MYIKQGINFINIQTNAIMGKVLKNNTLEKVFNEQELRHKNEEKIYRIVEQEDDTKYKRMEEIDQLLDSKLNNIIMRFAEDKIFSTIRHHVFSNTESWELNNEEIKEIIKDSNIHKNARNIIPGTLKLEKVSKSVRFADVLGLDLCQVNIYDAPSMQCDFQPEKNQPQNLQKNALNWRPSNRARKPRLLAPMFNQPIMNPDFLNILKKRKVCLENAFPEKNEDVSGVVRVVNADYNKRVVVLWTVDEWNSSHDEPAQFAASSTDGASDTFHFRLSPGSLPVYGRLQFCIRFVSGNEEYWDNNGGVNYTFFVISRGASIGFQINQLF